MAVKTFTQAEQLTAADTNTYLANGGWVYIGGGSVSGTGTTFSNVFSATYDNYVVVLSGFYGSTGANPVIQFGATATGYYGSRYYDLYDGTTTGTSRTNNGTSLAIGGYDGTHPGGSSTVYISQPYLAQRTVLHGTWFGNGYSGWLGGFLNNTTSYTACTISPNVGTITAGTARFYGLRQA